LCAVGAIGFASAMRETRRARDKAVIPPAALRQTAGCFGGQQYISTPLVLHAPSAASPTAGDFPRVDAPSDYWRRARQPAPRSALRALYLCRCLQRAATSGISKTTARFQHLAEAKPMAPTCANEAHGFPGRPLRDARSAEWERMTAWSLTLAARGIIRLSHHYALQARGPASELAV
jgi:hypothetical protein